MESALAWIGQIAEWIGKFFPRWAVLDVTMGGVKYVRGKPQLLTPGSIYWWWPVLTTVDLYPIARQADDLRSQTMVTTDNKVVIVGGMVVYEVSDIMKLMPTTFRPAEAIKDLCLTCIHDVICSMTWEELKQGQRKGTLDTDLRNTAKKALSDYGVTVIKVQLTDLAPARVIKLMGDYKQAG